MKTRIVKTFKDLSPLILFGLITIVLFISAMNVLPIPFSELAERALWLYFCFAVMILIVCAAISMSFVGLAVKLLKKKKGDKKE